MSAEEARPDTAQEVIVVDSDKNILKGLERVLTGVGLTVTAVPNPARARDQVEKRFIPVVLCDLDTPEPGEGLEMIKFARERSPLTSVIIMTTRRTFEAAAQAFRAGADDVVPKTQDSVQYLCERVKRAAIEVRSAESRETLLAELAEVNEDFLKRMMDLSRQVTDLEDKVLSREGEGSSASALSLVNVLLVDDEPALNAVLSRDLPADKGWRIRYAQSGGEALDGASQARPDILIVNETLPDLPATMVINTIKRNAPEAVALVFTAPGEGTTGEVRMMDSSRLLTLIPAFSEPEQLVSSLSEIREALRQKAKERRYVQSFRKQNFEFVKKYNNLKQRLAQKANK